MMKTFVQVYTRAHTPYVRAGLTFLR
jgi:hypothetical protein